MHPRFAAFPEALATRARAARVTHDRIPVLLAHPDWRTPSPTVVWLHGRTVSKELDPGRYLRLIRAGMAVCAVDLPGHGEREGARWHEPSHTLDVVEQAVGEIDGIVRALAGVEDGAAFDLGRVALGGMSAGGMVTMRRLCEPHGFRAGVVEGASGLLSELYFPRPGAQRKPWPVDHPRARVEGLDPSRHLTGWRPLPFMSIHTTGDAVVAFETQREFVERLRAHYLVCGADPDAPATRVELVTFTDTGAPLEHAGFGRYANEAKNAFVGFLAGALGAEETEGGV